MQVLDLSWFFFPVGLIFPRDSLEGLSIANNIKEFDQLIKKNYFSVWIGLSLTGWSFNSLETGIQSKVDAGYRNLFQELFYKQVLDLMSSMEEFAQLKRVSKAAVEGFALLTRRKKMEKFWNP